MKLCIPIFVVVLIFSIAVLHKHTQVSVKLEKDEYERKFGAFKKQLGKRVLHINISDSSTPPSPKASSAKVPATSVSPKASPKATLSRASPEASAIHTSPADEMDIAASPMDDPMENLTQQLEDEVDAIPDEEQEH